MQSVLSRIWTLVAVSISYNDNHYTMDTSLYQYLPIESWYKETSKKAREKIYDN